MDSVTICYKCGVIWNDENEFYYDLDFYIDNEEIYLCDACAKKITTWCEICEIEYEPYCSIYLNSSLTRSVHPRCRERVMEFMKEPF